MIKSIVIKDFNAFFSRPTGYIVVGAFYLVYGLIHWVFKGYFNILDSGYAELLFFFDLAPWGFMFLIPAVSMSSFSEEIHQGTLELLFTKPISNHKLILSKYLALILIGMLILIPSLCYVVVLYYLSLPIGSIDLGVILGSYLGLLLLIISFSAVGIFSSSLSRNQITAFIIGVVVCFFLYYGFNSLQDSHFLAQFLKQMSIKTHYDNISKGILDSRDVFVFLSYIILFLLFTLQRIKKMQHIK